MLDVSDSPKFFGDYRLLNNIGQGGMGLVWKAYHTRLDRIVAVKLIPVDLASQDGLVDRFRREAKAIGRLSHVNIVTAHDAGEREGWYFLVMEYVHGLDLGRLSRSAGHLPIADACELIRQSALGLQHVHEYGLVHRDVKPSNLMVTVPAILSGDLADSSIRPPPVGVVKLLDLGLSRSVNQSTAGGTQSGQVMGTVDYLAPEQLKDSRSVDIRADLYGLGATLYKLLTGQAPFAGDKYNTVVKKLVAIVGETPAPASEFRPDVPPELDSLLKQLLAKSPADRPGTSLEVTEVLARFSGTANLTDLLGPFACELSSASDANLAQDTSPGVQAHAGTPAVVDRLRRGRVRAKSWTPRRRWLLVGAVLVAGVVIGGTLRDRIVNKTARQTQRATNSGMTEAPNPKTTVPPATEAGQSDAPQPGQTPKRSTQKEPPPFTWPAELEDHMLGFRTIKEDGVYVFRPCGSAATEYERRIAEPDGSKGLTESLVYYTRPASKLEDNARAPVRWIVVDIPIPVRTDVQVDISLSVFVGEHSGLPGKGCGNVLFGLHDRSTSTLCLCPNLTASQREPSQFTLRFPLPSILDFNGSKDLDVRRGHDEAAAAAKKPNGEPLNPLLSGTDIPFKQWIPVRLWKPAQHQIGPDGKECDGIGAFFYFGWNVDRNGPRLLHSFPLEPGDLYVVLYTSGEAGMGVSRPVVTVTRPAVPPVKVRATNATPNVVPE